VIDFSDLYKKYSTDVFRFALYLSGNRADAEDIASETFVRAFASSDQIEMATVKAYLFAIARNLFLMGVRRGRSSPLPDGLRDSQPSAHDLVAHKEELAGVLAKLQELPEIDRTALLLRTLHGLPYEEIAGILKISTVAARVKVHRARAALLVVRKDQQ